MEQVTTHRKVLYTILLHHKTFKQLKKSQHFSIFFKNRKNEKARD